MSSRLPSREPAGGRAVLLVVVGLVLLLGAVWTAAYLGAGDRVPRGASVAGVDVGGRTPADAARVLEEGLAERSAAPITVTVPGGTQQVTPEEAGLSVDSAASVAAVGGEQSWDPRRLWAHYTGGEDLAPVVVVDETRMGDLLDRLGEDVGTPARDGAVTFVGPRVRVVEPRVGEELDADATGAALEAAYLQPDATVEPVTRAAQPRIDAADVQKALDDFANPALSGSVTLVFGRSPVRLQPRDFAAVLALRPEDGELVPDLDERRLRGLVDGAVGDEGAPVDATVELVDGRPRVVPAKPGVSYDPDDITDAFLELVTRPEGEREMRVRATVEEADFSTADARALGIRERVSSFTTYFPHAEYRNVNIGRAAELVTGTVLRPGETFSLNDVVGERTRENGFTEGFVISNGIFAEGLGGGVSQMATTTFNAAFFAGLEDVEHKPHSVYIDRYPVGREATVAWGSVDLRFTNDTPYGVLIEAGVTPSTPSSQGVVTVSMYSTDYWDITSVTSDRYDFTQPSTQRLSTPDCVPNTGYAGFEVDVTRIFRRAGEEEVDHRENFHTVYIPSDTVICE